MAGPENWLGINLGDIIAQSQNMRLRDMQMQKYQHDIEQENARQNAYRGLVSPDGSINRGGLSSLAEVDPKAYFEVQQHLSAMDENGRKATAQKYKMAAPLAVKARRMPYEARRGFIASATPFLAAQGWTPEEIAQFDPSDQNLDALASTAMTMEQVLSDGKIDWKQIGGEAGGLAAFDQMGNPIGSGNPYAGAAVRPTGDVPAAPAGDIPPDLFEALIQQESGGNGNAISNQGALGSTQMLPGTAQEMAQKLGMPWRPELMRNSSPEALQYQRALGQAYLQEGFQKYGGDTRKALMYYHGGPNENIWGPKTRAYPDQVLSRLGQAPQATPVATPGYIPGRPKPKEAPSGYRWNGDSLQAIPGGPADKPASGKDAPAGYRWTANGGLEFIPGGPADPRKKSTEGAARLPAGEIEKLTKDAEKLDTMAELVGSFKDGFSGAGSRVENWAGRLTPESWGLSTPGQADWWQSMDQFDNVVRNELFGASLTTGEQAAWKASTVTPNMDPSRVKANLKRREGILRRALSRKRQALQEGGYNVPGLSAPSNGAKFLGFE